MSQMNILILCSDSKCGEIYARDCREIGEVHVDLLSNVDNALNWLGKIRYNVVILDLNRPLFTLERIKRIHPEACVIVLAAHPTIEEAVRAIRFGAEDFLRKPVSVEAFKLAVQRGLNRKVLFDEENAYSKSLNLVNSCQLISASLEEPRILSIVKGYLSREVSSIHVGLFTRESDKSIRFVDPDQSMNKGLEEIFSSALSQFNLDELFSGSESCYRFVEKSDKGSSVFFFRFMGLDGREYYYVGLSAKKMDEFTDFEGRLKILSAQIDVTTQNIMRYRDVQKLAFVDDLTGLHNTRYLNHILDREFERAKSQNIPFAILFIDADRFKSVNDQHGHLYGSRLLSELGKKIKSCVRDSDIVVRYGGDEFIALLSPCDLETGKRVAERIRKSIESSIFFSEEGLSLKVTVSIGVALFPEHATTKEDVIEAADQAMYHAKKESRNAVIIADLSKNAKDLSSA